MCCGIVITTSDWINIGAAIIQAVVMLVLITQSKTLSSQSKTLGDSVEEMISARKDERSKSRASINVVLDGDWIKESSIGENGLFLFKPTIQNIGETRAENVEFVSAAYVAEAGGLALFATRQGAIPFSLEPGGKVIKEDYKYLGKEDLNMVKTYFPPDKSLYFMGAVWYDDVYGDTWETRFCWELKWLPNAMIPHAFPTKDHNFKAPETPTPI